MAKAQGRDWVRERVKQELASRGWNIADLSRESGLDAGTVGDFLSGSRWPQIATRKRITDAFGWTPESLARMERGDEPVRSGRGDRHLGLVDSNDPDTEVVVLTLPTEVLAGFGPVEREEVLAAAKLSAIRAAQQIRRRLANQDAETTRHAAYTGDGDDESRL